MIEEVLSRETNSGYQLYTRPGTSSIVRISSDASKSVRLGQLVKSNGRFFVAAGTIGIVIAIHVPYEGGHTSNVIEVWFEGQLTSSRMKFRDLQF